MQLHISGAYHRSSSKLIFALITRGLTFLSFYCTVFGRYDLLSRAEKKSERRAYVRVGRAVAVRIAVAVDIARVRRTTASD